MREHWGAAVGHAYAHSELCDLPYQPELPTAQIESNTVVAPDLADADGKSDSDDDQDDGDLEYAMCDREDELCDLVEDVNADEDEY